MQLLSKSRCARHKTSLIDKVWMAFFALALLYCLAQLARTAAEGFDAESIFLLVTLAAVVATVAIFAGYAVWDRTGWEEIWVEGRMVTIVRHNKMLHSKDVFDAGQIASIGLVPDEYRAACARRRMGRGDAQNTIVVTLADNRQIRCGVALTEENRENVRQQLIRLHKKYN